MVVDLLERLKVFCKKILYICLLACLSCAKLGYIVKQGVGQISIQMKAVKNSKVLEDPKVSDEDKAKIRIIGVYKKYYEEFFEQKFDDIYEKTTFLDRKAVSYMVTASPKNEIKPHRVSFPFVGSFPYLAFFSLDSAKEFAKDLEEDGMVTWIRPVYAYSSLNYFDDRILSSFFVYSETELAELVFHELTHLLVFVKDDVGFNESLAQYIAHKVLERYMDGSEAADFIVKRQESRSLAKDLVPKIQELNKTYKALSEPKSIEKARIHFLENILFKRMEEYCTNSGTECALDVKNWNNARLVGYLNYEGRYERIENVHIKLGYNLKQFAKWIKNAEEEKNEDIPFLDYLEKKASL